MHRGSFLCEKKTARDETGKHCGPFQANGGQDCSSGDGAGRGGRGGGGGFLVHRDALSTLLSELVPDSININMTGALQGALANPALFMGNYRRRRSLGVHVRHYITDR